MMVQEKNAPALGADDRQWHTLASDQVLATIASQPDGLTPDEAAKRLATHGPNVIPQQGADGPLKVLWRQINNPLVWVLIGAAALAVGLGKVTDGLVVFAVVVLNAAIGFVQEFRAGKAIEALAKMVPQNANVMRGGQKVSVPAADLVPGDVVLLASGDRVPADMRLLQVKSLQVEEAALTGESVPSEKGVDAVDLAAPLGDRKGMVFGGTLVTYGTGTAVVVETGAKTELGRISKMLGDATDLETPLTKALAQISKILTVAILVVSVILLGISMLRGWSFADAVLGAITLAVAAIPEGLPAIVTIALAIGVQRMAARRAVVRKLPAVETLGSTTVICSDKTGTLTRNEMTVQALWTPQAGKYEITGVGYEAVGELRRDGQVLADVPVDVRELLSVGALCNDAAMEHDGTVRRVNGDPTEGALLVAAEKVRLDQAALNNEQPRLDAIPFESENQFMATLHRDPLGGRRILLKGAPEVVMRRCQGIDEAKALGEMEAMARNGMRVLAFAVRSHDRDDLQMEDTDGGYTLVGLQGMIDPPRQEAIEAIRKCHAAGITVKMITGDHRATAEAIGRELNIVGDGGAVSGTELAKMDEKELREVAKRTNVFARVAPEHKLRLVKALQDEGRVVAMTGDGVNDAPALKQSNIGVAMGITGTSVSKEAADIVLTDDNFASIAAAVEEGRRVYDNLLKSLAFVLPTNLGLAFILMAAVAFFPIQNIGGQLVPLMPMMPTQLLWINLVATVALALPLAFEAKEPNVMARPPRDPKEPVLSRFVINRTVLAAVLMCLGAIGLFNWEYSRELARVGHEIALKEAQTMAVTTVIMFQIFYMLNCRSLKDSMLKIGLFSNPTVYIGIVSLIALQLAFIYVPVMNRIFGTQPLDAAALGLCTLVGAIILPIISIEKWWANRKA